jgi:hypothetical protein
MTPTQRTKQHLEHHGYRVAIVERWNAFARIRQDLYGFIDLLAMKPHHPLLAIQCTSTGNLPARVKKIQASEHYPIWLSTGCHLEAWGWAKRGERGKRKTWTLKKVVLPQPAQEITP